MSMIRLSHLALLDHTDRLERVQDSRGRSPRRRCCRQSRPNPKFRIAAQSGGFIPSPGRTLSTRKWSRIKSILSI